MTHEQYRGEGEFIVEGASHPCSYRIEVIRTARAIDAVGTVTASPGALLAAFEAGGAELRMSDGRACPVVVRNLSLGSGTAPVASSDTSWVER